MGVFRKIVKAIVPNWLFRLVEPTGHLIEAIWANIKYGFPSRKMHVIGVTGTNGKTTTTMMIYRILHEAGLKVGALSTVAYGTGDELNPQIEHMTTAAAGILQRRLRDFKKNGVQWVVLETSSHSLAQHRIWGVPYEIAVITNVTGDHLDYHKTFERYLKAKLKLFKLASKRGRRFGVVNADDPNSQAFIDAIPKSVTYGIKAGSLRANNVQLAADKSTCKAVIGEDEYDIRVNIPGDFNISNALAAIAVGRELGLSKEQIQQGIVSLKSVEGRMAVINEGQPFKVIVDHASTPDAFERFFANVRPVTKGRLIAVFGSAGRRDESKRAVQGEIAGKYCEEVILTEEDDRDIDGNEILKQIADGSIKAGKVINKNLFLVPDRKKAIALALIHAKYPDDTVVLLGKGHEKTIERADGEHAWNESEITRKLLRILLSKTNQASK